VSQIESARSIVQAINSQDRTLFYGAFAAPETVQMTDDGSPHNFTEWAEGELFGVQNHLTVNVEREDGRTVRLEGSYQSAKWGTFNTFWRFTFDDVGKVSHLDVGAL
jgi:hypothetical protein